MPFGFFIAVFELVWNRYTSCFIVNLVFKGGLRVWADSLRGPRCIEIVVY